MDRTSRTGTKTSPVIFQHDVGVQKYPPLLPATCRDRQNLIVYPEQDLDSFLCNDLLTTRFTRIRDHLWLAGRPLPPRALHTQLLMCRDIIVTEQIELHLVWTKGKIFVKPLPRYLLDTAFREKHFPDSDISGTLSRCARGLLHSYTALVASESDFRIAMTRGLLPPDTKWHAWHAFVRDLITQPDIYNVIDERYRYGELRLARLNKISRMTSVRGLIYGYAPELATSEYSDFFANNFGVVVAVLSYVVIVLTAMQVGLGTKHLQENSAFNWACYVFTMFSLLTPLVAAGVIISAFLFMLISHWIRTMADHRRRFEAMGISPRSDSTTV